jgi:hypothetical protein
MERWEFDYRPYVSDEDPGDYEPPPEAPPDFPFLATRLTPEVIASSLQQDLRGLRRAVLHGMPVLNETDGNVLRVDEDGVPLEEEEAEEDAEQNGEVPLDAYFRFVLWKPAVINGQLRDVGAQDLLIRDSGIKKYPPLGGALARYLFPIVIADEKSRNPQVNGAEAWGWLPPPLVREGDKVQTAWLHDFLMSPYPIRPAVVLRMPKFTMSSAEATALANYFAAVDGSEFPYALNSSRNSAAGGGQDGVDMQQLQRGLAIVVDNNYCVKCHVVGDFVPPGSPTALAPDLGRVYDRLKVTFVRDWVANPKRYLPYTGMPVNIPFKAEPPLFGGVSQELFPGTSLDQLSGVVNLLMNFDRFALVHTSIRPFVKPPPAAAAEAGE